MSMLHRPSMNPFSAGQQVVCINGNWKPGPDMLNVAKPKKNEILTVTTVYGIWLTFTEYNLPTGPCYWIYDHFAPLSDNDCTNMEIDDESEEFVELIEEQLQEA